MELAEVQRDIEADGYSIVRGFVDSARVEELRVLCERLKVSSEILATKEHSAQTILRVPDIMTRTRELDSLVTDTRLLDALRMVIGA